MNGFDDEIRDARPEPGAAEEREARLRRRRYARPAADIFSTDSEMVVLADMPGVARDDLDVTLDGDELVIEAPAAGRAEEESGLPWGYYRRFKLRTPFERDRIRARIEGGVLEITLPKERSQRAQKVTIE